MDQNGNSAFFIAQKICLSWNNDHIYFANTSSIYYRSIKAN